MSSTGDHLSVRHWGWVRTHLAVMATLTLALLAVGLLVPGAPGVLLGFVWFALAFVTTLIWTGTRFAVTVELSGEELSWRTPFGLTGEALVGQLVEVSRAPGGLNGSVWILRFVNDRSIYVTDGPQMLRFLSAIRRAVPDIPVEA